MSPLNLPTYNYKVKSENDKTYIFDEVRKKYVVLTSEEWVRQHLINLLVIEKKYPKSLMAVETSITINKLSRRCDIVLYNNTGLPVMIVECKAPSVKLSQATFDQVAAYNLTMKVDFLMISNGMQHYCCKMDYANNSWQFLHEIPGYAGEK